MLSSRRVLIALAGALLATPTPGLVSQVPVAAAIPAAGDEFVGPFASWTDVRTRYGAAGDGVTDDTAALQRALSELGAGGRSPVLYLPAGTYRITAPLVLANRLNVSVVGADPTTTSVVWDGPAGGTMLVVDGVAYSRIVRLTFDGRARAAIAVDQSWNGKAGPFDTGNEYGDDRFVDAGVGIRGGFQGHGFAETTVVRSAFVRNTVAGISLGNFNALDLWVWYSLFDRCAIGVTNGSGAGNFRIYNSVFRQSSVADLFMQNTGAFSARGNYSSGSRAFFLSQGNTNNPATIHLQRNTIVDPLESTVIRMGNQGPAVLTDNVVRSRPAAAAPVVQWASFLGSDVASIGNTFTVASAVQSSGRLLSIDDRTVDAATLAPTEPTLPPPWPNLRRRVFDVAPGADAAAIQQAIDRAAAAPDARPVVHLPAGIYDVARTIVVPAGDVQIAGDGFATVLRWTGAGTGPVVRIDGPSQAALRELRVDGGGRADGVVLAGMDRPGARIYMQGVQLRGGGVASLHVDGVDHAYLQLEDFGQAAAPEGRAVVVTGGPERRAGRATDGGVSIFSGASSRSRLSLDISDGGKVLVRDVWYESAESPGYARIHGRATFTADGLRVASPPGQATPAFDIQGLDGDVAIIATHFDDRIGVSGDGRAARVLALGVFCQQAFARCYENSSSPPARAAIAMARGLSRLPFTRSAAVEAGDPPPADFVREMLRHARAEMPAPLAALPPGIPDVRLFRVWIDGGRTNVVVR